MWCGNYNGTNVHDANVGGSVKFEQTCLKRIVVTYSQFDSNIHILYVFLGFLKNTWKYLKILDHRCLWVWAQLKLSLLIVLLIVFTYFTYSHFQILKYFFLSTFEKYAYFVFHYYVKTESVSFAIVWQQWNLLKLIFTTSMWTLSNISHDQFQSLVDLEEFKSIAMPIIWCHIY